MDKYFTHLLKDISESVLQKKFKSKNFAKSGERHVMLGKILEDIIEI